ncbi:MAG TPA: L-rhamnose isomerase [Armatimonadetes bacterium]|nr:L-rhamnose isomerase [Armatimonadota bacterium]
MAYDFHTEYEILAEKLRARGLEVEQIKQRLKAQEIETPSWGYADSGTRFGVFKQPGAAATIFEKLDDAAQVHKFTGIAPKVALHVLWDLTEDVEAVKQYAAELGMRLGSINPNVFQDQCYKYGSFCNPDPAVRQRALEHCLECLEIAKQVGSHVLSIWLADGTNYPGQDDFRARKNRLQEGLGRVYAALPADMTMLVEYKFFEPAFYHTDLSDWGMAYVLCKHLGPQAKVLVDLGHHAQGVNIEHLVAFLLDEGMLGGFHFNNRKYADDDLTVGSINPYEFFLIYHELAAAEEDPHLDAQVEYMVDQSHNLKPKIEAMIQTVMVIQETYAKALTVNRRALREAQEAGALIDAECMLQEAFNTNVTPLLKVVREEMGLDPDPLAAYRASGYQQKIEVERGEREVAGGLGV